MLLAVASLTACGSGATSAAARVSATPADPVAACGQPSTGFARFWGLTAEPTPGEYTGTIRVGAARVPVMSMYVSGGAPGTGVLCVSSRYRSDPVQSTAAPRPGAIAYLGAAGNPRDTVFFATRPGVTRVTMGGGSLPAVTFSLHGVQEEQLGSLGNGWHAADTGYGYFGGAMTLRAYDSSGTLLDTVTEQYTAANPTPSQP